MEVDEWCIVFCAVCLKRCDTPFEQCSVAYERNVMLVGNMSVYRGDLIHHRDNVSAF